MDRIAVELAEYLAQFLQSTDPSARLLVGIAGVPASGKSTLVQHIVDYLNDTLPLGNEPSRTDDTTRKDVAVSVGLDGWHLTRAQLDALPDPKLAHDRRGAHWTFDAVAYVDFVRVLRQPRSEEVIYAPTFSHVIKDPTPYAVPVFAHNRIVLIEGLYTFLGITPWRTAAEMLDERWWIDVSEEEAQKRLVARHVESGVAKELEEAMWRSRENDAPNGRFIKENMLKPTKIIHSVEDPRFSS
ncbi:P-loop containing nucleoside triphosphate hydrolase protein [Sparassis latifolia]